MSIYRYGKGSVIDEVTFEKSDGGSLRAYLHALPGTNEQTFSDISLAMAKRGWQTVPHTLAGKPVLEIRGFDRNTQVNAILFDNDWAHGPAAIETERNDSKKFSDTVKKRSLFLSGFAYLAGDAAFIAYGHKGKSPLNVAAGAAYGGGTLSSLLFARKDAPDLQIKEVAGKMAAYMREQNIDVPNDCALHSITDDRHKGIIKTADDFFRRYPAEMMNSFFAIAGACIATAAMKNEVFGKATHNAVKEVLRKQKENYKSIAPNMPKKHYTKMAWEEVKKHKRSTGLLDAGLGTMTMASAAFGNFVEEKAHDPDSPRKHGIGGVWEWMQERPLAIAGAGYMVSTMCHLTSTLKVSKDGDSEARKSVKWRGLFVFTNLLAELLIAMSSKGHGKGVVSDKSVDNSAISLAADLIAKQPPAKHDYLIDYMSGFLGRDDVLAMKDTEVKDLLRTQVELMKNNPWAKCMALAAESENKSNGNSLPGKGGNKTSWQSSVKSVRPESQSPSFI